jgi:putative redox protein
MATTSVVWKEGMHFCTKVESGELMCDESSEVGKAYPSAPELLMASLGSCIASVLVYFAQRHDIVLEGMRVDLDWEVAEEPHRIGEIDVRVSVPRSLSESERTTLERVAHACLIHNTLTHPPEIALTLSAGS